MLAGVRIHFHRHGLLGVLASSAHADTVTSRKVLHRPAAFFISQNTTRLTCFVLRFTQSLSSTFREDCHLVSFRPADVSQNLHCATLLPYCSYVYAVPQCRIGHHEMHCCCTRPTPADASRIPPNLTCSCFRLVPDLDRGINAGRCRLPL